MPTGLPTLDQHLVNLAESVGGNVGEEWIVVIGAEGFQELSEVEAGGLVGPGTIGDGEGRISRSMPE